MSESTTDRKSVVQHLGLEDTPTSRALLTLLDQTIARVDRRGRILGVWFGDRLLEELVTGSTLARIVKRPDRFATDLLDDKTRSLVLATIAETLDTGTPRTIEFTTQAAGVLRRLQGRCAPCGNDEVIWTTRDLTVEYEHRRLSERRADLEAMLGDGLQSLLDVGDSDEDFDQVLGALLGDMAVFFGAAAAYLRRFRGAGHIEIVSQWRASPKGYAPPGTSRAGGAYFPWAARRLARNPVLVAHNLSSLAPEAAVDVANLAGGGDEGFVWVSIGPGRRPTGLLGLTFDGSPVDERDESYEPLVGFSTTVLGIVNRREEGARRAVQRRVFESIAHGASIDAALSQVCDFRESGTTGRHAVIWLGDDPDALRPVGSSSVAAELREFTCYPTIGEGAAPEIEVFRSGQRCWLQATDADLGPIAARLDATAVEVIPLTMPTSSQVVGVFALYDTSRLPLDPSVDTDGAQGALATSLATLAIERVEDLAELAHRASHDSLTGLANRETFLERLEQAISQSDPADGLIAVLYCDVDHFKELNDRLGHAHGDRFLVDVARVLGELIAPPNVVARLGGDEFAVLLCGLGDENDARLVAERIRSGVATASTAPSHPVSVSIGVAVSGIAADHAEGLLRDADIAMYQAKSSGRDRIELFAGGMRRKAQARDQLGRDLASALRRDALDVYYQPMIDLVTGRVRGFEALARWHDPVRGPIAPAEFIPVAESGGMIGALGAFVMSRAVAQLADWDDADLHFNLSAREVGAVGFADKVLERLSGSGVSIERVAIEITESVLLSDSAPTVENLHRLTEAGLGLVLDDFGTGYASMTYLRRFPFRGIKIDRSFVAEIDRSPDDSAIVAMMLALAATLDLEVIAEGVETAAQETRLRELGCRFVQGFRYAKAVPADETVGLIERFATSGTPADLF